MAGMENNERSAPAGAEYRWWLMVVVLLIGAGALLLLPSLLLSTTLALPVAAVSIAVALVAWIRQGSGYWRVSAGLFALAGVALLALSLSQPATEANLSASSWRTVTACMLMGFALVVGLLASLERRSRRPRPAVAPPPHADATAGADSVAAIAEPAHAAGIVLTPEAGAIDGETLERILAHYKVALVRGDSGTLSLEMVIDSVRGSIRDALSWVLRESQSGDAAAMAALNQAQQTNDLAGVQAYLAQAADAASSGSDTAQEDRVALNRNLGALALLAGQADEVQRRLKDVLAASPTDALAVEYLALAAELRGDVNEAEHWYCCLLTCPADPLLLACAHGQLGLIYQTRDELDKAERMHRQALAISEDLGRLEEVANQLGQLGAVHEMRGQVDLAETMYRRALQIHEQLGRLEGMASQYVNLGLLASQRDDVPAARDLYASARDLFAKAGLSGNARLVQQLLDELAVQ